MNKLHIYKTIIALHVARTAFNVTHRIRVSQIGKRNELFAHTRVMAKMANSIFPENVNTQFEN